MSMVLHWPLFAAPASIHTRRARPSFPRDRDGLREHRPSRKIQFGSTENPCDSGGSTPQTPPGRIRQRPGADPNVAGTRDAPTSLYVVHFAEQLPHIKYFRSAGEVSQGLPDLSRHLKSARGRYKLDNGLHTNDH